MSSNYEKLKKAYANDPEMLAMLERKESQEILRSLADGITKKTAVEIAMELKKGDKGDPGDNGYTPVKGKDYFTRDEVEKLAQYLLDTVKNEVTPRKGEDYFDGEDADEDEMIKRLAKMIPTVEEIVSQVKMPEIPKIDEDGMLSRFLSSIPKVESLTIEQIVKEIKEKKLLELRDIKGARLDSPSTSGQYLHGGGLTTIYNGGTLVTNNMTSLVFTGAGVSSIVDVNGQVTVTISGGGGGGETLAQTLAIGNVTGGNDIIVSTGDVLKGQTDITMQDSTGNSFYYASASYIFQQWDDGLGMGNTDFLLQGAGTQLFSHIGISIQADTGVYKFFSGSGTNKEGTLDFSGLTNNQTYTFQDASGTLAFLTDIPSLPLSLGNGGTGSSLSDPGFDAVFVWDNTTNTTRLAQLSGLSYNSGTNTLTASGSGLSLETNGTPNGDQTLLNLIDGTGISITDDGMGGVTISATGGSTPVLLANQIAYGSALNLMTSDVNFTRDATSFEIAMIYPAVGGNLEMKNGATLGSDMISFKQNDVNNPIILAIGNTGGLGGSPDSLMVTAQDVALTENLSMYMDSSDWEVSVGDGSTSSGYQATPIYSSMNHFTGSVVYRFQTDALGFTFNDSSTGVLGIFNFSNLLTTNKTYTFQNANGTLAFLSDIPVVTGFATRALDNLAAVAINTTLVSDTDVTDDLGTTSIKWRTIYGANLGATATRFTTGWFTDLTVTNAISGSITGNAATITVADEITDATCFIGFYTAATGSLGGKTNANMTFNAATGVATFASTVLTTTDINGGTIDATVIGGATPAAGTFTIVTVDNLTIDLNTISSTSGNLNLTPVAGSAILLDGTISVDAGVVTGITSLGVTGTRVTAGFFVDLTVTNAIAGSITGNAATTTAANEATDTTCFITFATDATGAVGTKTNANMTFNSNTGVATFASTVLTTTDINGGTIDGTVIGGASAAAGTFTTLIITSFGANWTNAGRTVADLGVITTVDINGGTIDGTIIGGANAAAGTFTTHTSNNLLAASNDVGAIGASGTAWSDLFLASGAVINFFAGNATITHSASLLTSNVDIAVPDEVYGVGWDGSLEVPTKNAVYDKIQSLAGGFTWNEVTGATQQMAVNNGYVANRASLITFTLPATAAVGSVIEIVGVGAGGWQIDQNAGDIIHVGNTASLAGTGGHVASSNAYDSIRLVCVVADNEWTATSVMGTLTITTS